MTIRTRVWTKVAGGMPVTNRVSSRVCAFLFWRNEAGRVLRAVGRVL